MASTVTVGNLVSNTYPPAVGTQHVVSFDGSDYVLVPMSATTFAPTTVELNLPAYGVSEWSQTFPDSNCTATSNIVASISGQAATGKDQDEAGMDSFQIVAQPQAGNVTIYIRGLEGNIAGNFRVTYMGY